MGQRVVLNRLVLSSWIGGLAFEGWTLQVGCLVLVVSIGTFRSSDATLKTTAPDFGVCCTSHFRKVGFKHSMFKSSVGAACAVLVRGRPLDIEARERNVLSSLRAFNHLEFRGVSPCV